MTEHVQYAGGNQPWRSRWFGPKWFRFGYTERRTVIGTRVGWIFKVSAMRVHIDIEWKVKAK